MSYNEARYRSFYYFVLPDGVNVDCFMFKEIMKRYSSYHLDFVALILPQHIGAIVDSSRLDWKNSYQDLEYSICHEIGER